MSYLRLVVTSFVGAACAALVACSSAPTDDSSATNDSLVVVKEKSVCWLTNPNQCDDAEPHSVAGDIATPLAFDFFCKGFGTYQWGGAWFEEYALCPVGQESAISQWAATKPPNFHLNIHVAPNACDVCLPPAPAGYVYFFWGKRWQGPTCQGSNCKSAASGW